ncbi:MAG: 30S ribosomal protein S12 methylthiotransferase RimO [Ignavibacteria bacterium]|nr:30S ribosomal protein S12 methylthiotransferase RimO [Ignavibacteria bacterium]
MFIDKDLSSSMKVSLITLGCSKNLVDSETLLRQFKANRISIIDEPQKADAIVVNTCGFINDAKNESLETIFQSAQLKKNGKLKKLLVMGCLSERYSQQLKKEIPEVDKFFGVTDYAAVLRELGSELKYNLLGERVLTTPKHFAYLKISEGCDNPCSFCAIPLIRGKHKSKPIEKIISEAEFLVSKGVKEIILIAQDSTYYGIDLYGSRKLAHLIKELCKIENIKWIRLLYTFPSQFPEDVLEVMAEEKKVCKYLDIPLQHISDSILKSMRRGITKRQTYHLIEKIKKAVPNITLRTTLIVGYPNETEKEFKELEKFVKEIEFDRLGVFTYSQEDDTIAFELGDPIPTKEKELRRKHIMEIQREISLKNNEKLIDKSIKVIIDEKHNSTYLGRTEGDAPEIDNEVIIKSKKKLFVGDFYNVHINDFTEYDLYGSV